MNRAWLPALLIGACLVQPAGAQTNVFTLEECVQYALSYSPALARKALSHTNQVLSVAQAETKFTPTLTVKDSYVDSSERNTLEGSVSQPLPGDLDVTLSATRDNRPGEEVDEVTSYALRLSKTLLGGGSVLESRLGIRKERLDEAAEWNRYSQDRRRLRFTVAKAYYAVVRNQMTLGLRKLQLERARRNLEVAEVRQEPLDIATARLRIPQGELDLVRTQRGIADSLLALREIIGMPMAAALRTGTNVEYRVAQLRVEEDLAFALRNHEDILNARLALDKAQLDARVAGTRVFPTLVGSVNLRDSDNMDEPEARAELALTIPWGDRSDRLAARKAENTVRDRELALFEAKQARSRSVRSLALRVREAQQAVALQEEQVKVLEQQLDLYQDRWDNGEIDILEFIRSQNDLENARVQLVSQKTQYHELLAEYRFNVGR